MYVSPSVDQTKVFSYDRIAPPLESPFIQKYYMGSSLTQNVLSKKFLNNANIYLRYASQDGDRLRGFSSDAIFYDEAQDLIEEIIPVANQGMSRSFYKWNYFSGTPKRTVGTLQNRFEKSTKNEWLVKCFHCNKWNYLDEKNIGKKGLICRYCGKLIDPKNGQWVRTNASDPDDYYEGFRVSQLQFFNAPWVDWAKDIVALYETQPRGLFFNEVLGLPYDEGTAPITRKEIRACQTGEPLHEEPTKPDLSRPNYIGIDYGPANSRKSHTVLIVLQVQGDVIKVLYTKRYIGEEASFAFIHKDVPRLMAKWKAVLIGSDYGLGEAANSEIRKQIGIEKLVAVQHQGTQKVRAQYNGKMGAVTTSRNIVMTEFFQRIKNQGFIFPKGKKFDSFVSDIVSVSIEYDEIKNKYKYINANPDDFVHAVIYGTLVSEIGEQAF